MWIYACKFRYLPKETRDIRSPRVGFIGSCELTSLLGTQLGLYERVL